LSSASAPPFGSLDSIERLGIVNVKKEELRVKHGHSTYNNNNVNNGVEDSHRLIEKPAPVGNLRGVANIVILDFVNVLLLAWPLGCASYFLEWGEIWTFWLNFLAMIPLAKILGDATEELAAGLHNDTVGGLLNATFGNAVEMILTVQTLRAGQLAVVKGTLLGSVLSNLLLVLGMSFFVGGLTRVEGMPLRGKEQHFNTQAALVNMTMLFLATAALALPAVFFATTKSIEWEGEDRHPDQDVLDTYIAGTSPMLLSISRWCSVYILSAYVAFLIFQLYTHADLFKGEEDDDDEEPQISPWVATVLLCVTTIFVAVSSEFLVDSIDGIVEKWEMSNAFIGVVLLPIVGNACEHAGAVRMAMNEKVDITIGIAVGSSTQISLFVVPFSVLMGWALGQPMDLNFGALETTVLVFSVLITFSIISDGSSNWLEGFMLMIAYAVVGTLFWFSPDKQ